MRVIEQSSFLDDEGNLSVGNRFRSWLEYGIGWPGEVKAQAELSRKLGRHLSDEHVLLRNAKLPGSDLTVPLILLGPQGVRTILPTNRGGVFRAKGEDWYQFNSRTRRFKRTRPNLQSLADSYARAVHAYLQGQGVPLPEVEPVLAVVNPRTHIDTAGPSVRIVQADAFDHFANNLQKFQPIMDQEDVRELTQLIINPPMLEPEPDPELEPEPAIDEFGDDLPTEFDPFQLEDSPAARQARSLRFGMTPRQLLLLGILLLMNLLVLFVFGAIILADSAL